MLVDQNTGECWATAKEYKDSSKVGHKHKPDGYVGIDYPFISECKDADTLYKALRQVDSYLQPKSRIMVDAAYLLDCVATGLISQRNLATLLTLSKSCVGWNYGFTTKEKLLSASGVTPRNYARWLEEMSAYITIVKLHKTSNESLILFNPVVVWKGCKLMREASIANKYKA